MWSFLVTNSTDQVFAALKKLQILVIRRHQSILALSPWHCLHGNPSWYLPFSTDFYTWWLLRINCKCLLLDFWTSYFCGGTCHVRFDRTLNAYFWHPLSLHDSESLEYNRLCNNEPCVPAWPVTANISPTLLWTFNSIRQQNEFHRDSASTAANSRFLSDKKPFFVLIVRRLMDRTCSICLYVRCISVCFENHTSG